jgi:GTP cyclohydrolase I
MIPFFGKAHIAYIPNGKICGLSKIPRVVDAFARRLQVQERLTMEIRDCIDEVLSPLGVAVVVECHHLCMQMRGVQKQNSVTTTSAFVGEFEKQTTRQEFISLLSAKLA